MRTVYLEEMTWPEVRKLLDAGIHTAIIPTGSIEQHGYHLPLATDTLLARGIAGALARELGDAVVAPVIRPGISPHHMGLPGSMTLRPETFQMLIEDCLSSLLHHGFDRIVITAFHGGNCAPAAAMLSAWREKFPKLQLLIADEIPSQEMLSQEAALLGLPDGANRGHADDRETSELLALDPSLVHMERAAQGFTAEISPELLTDFFTKGVLALTEVGALGDPTGADAARGAVYISRTVGRLSHVIREAFAG